MTIKEFSILTGIDYQECVNAVAASSVHVRGKLIDYEPEQIRSAVIDYLQKKERIGEHKLADIRRKLVLVYGMEAS